MHPYERFHIQHVWIFFISKIGTVTQKNDDVESAPSLINNSPEKDGWLFKVKLSDAEELKNLMDQAAYEAYLKEHEEWCLEIIKYSHFQMIQCPKTKQMLWRNRLDLGKNKFKVITIYFRSKKCG